MLVVHFVFDDYNPSLLAKGYDPHPFSCEENGCGW